MKIYIGTEKEEGKIYSCVMVTEKSGKVIYTSKKRVEVVGERYDIELRTILRGVKKIGVMLLNKELEVECEENIKIIIKGKIVYSWLEDMNKSPRKYISKVGEVLYELSYYPKEVEILMDEGVVTKRLKQVLKKEKEKKSGISAKELWR